MTWPALAALLAFGCGRQAVDGTAMGTTYAVQAACPGMLANLPIAATLAEVELRMSTWDDASELSRFNRAAVGELVAVSVPLFATVAAATRLAAKTDGALDPTVAPLVAAWGFGAHAQAEPPTPADIRASRLQVGYQRLALQPRPPALTKLAPLTLDLSSVAKGYAVDRVADVLTGAGCGAYLVELGGELRVAGAGPGGRPWRIGVESPSGGGPLATLAIHEGAIATAGNYRQTRRVGEREVSHVIDPRSGQPTAHGLASVTVVATTSLAADGYATALLVLGPEDGMAFAEREGLAAVFVASAGDRFEVSKTKTAAAYMAD